MILGPTKWIQFWDSGLPGASHTCQSETDLVNEAISVLLGAASVCSPMKYEILRAHSVHSVHAQYTVFMHSAHAVQ